MLSVSGDRDRYLEVLSGARLLGAIGGAIVHVAGKFIALDMGIERSIGIDVDIRFYFIQVYLWSMWYKTSGEF